MIIFYIDFYFCNYESPQYTSQYIYIKLRQHLAISFHILVLLTYFET